MEASKEFFRDIGAMVASNKCFMSSTCQATRSALRKYRWGKDGEEIPVKNHFRDLGAHLCMDQTNTAKTLNDRLDQAADDATKT